jgi:hypothetical protein
LGPVANATAVTIPSIDGEVLANSHGFWRHISSPVQQPAELIEKAVPFHHFFGTDWTSGSNLILVSLVCPSLYLLVREQSYRTSHQGKESVDSERRHPENGTLTPARIF